MSNVKSVVAGIAYTVTEDGDETDAWAMSIEELDQIFGAWEPMDRGVESTLRSWDYGKLSFKPSVQSCANGCTFVVQARFLLEIISQ